MSNPVNGVDRRTSLLLLALIALITLYRGLVLSHLGLDLYVDEAQYWLWAQHLTWGYYSKPPMIALLIALTTAIGGNGVFWVKAGALLVYPLTTWIIFLIGRRLFDARIGFWTALTFLLLPGVSFSSMIISTDVPFFLFWAAGLYAYLRALDGDRWRWWLAAGVAGGLGLQTKYTMIIFPVSVLLHLAVTPALRDRLRSPKLWATMLLAAVIFIPNLLWNAANGWPTLIHTEQISHLKSDAGLHWNHLSDFLGSQFAVMGPILFGAWLWLTIWRPSRWWQNPQLRLLNCFALPFLGIISLQALFGRADANWGAMTYVGATLFVVADLLRLDRRRLFAAGLALNVLLMPVAYHFDTWTRTLGIRLTAHNDPYKRVRGWARFCHKVGVLWNQHPQALLLADERDLMSEFGYYLRPRGEHAMLWNPDHRVESQYALSTTMRNKRGRDFLYITHAARLPPRVRAAFAGSQALGPVKVQIHPDWSLSYHAWLLHDFLGYPPARP